MGGEGNNWLERLPLAASRPWLAAGATLAMVAVAAVGRWLLLGAMPVGSPFVTFFPTVLLVCFLFGVRYGVIAAGISALLGWAFFVRDPMQPSFVLQSFPAIVPFLILITLNLGIFAWMQRINARLRIERERSAALADTRELLFRELQHRVSNNLQVAAGLLALQKKRVSDPEARTALDEAARRLGVIGRISRQLYEAEGTTRSLRAFLEPLCADVVDAGGKPGVALTITGGEDMTLPSDAAIPVALIVAEAVANAIEHGFADRDGGAIEVELVRDGGHIRIEVRDDGKGLPDGFDMAAKGSLGLGIATMLAGQLKGRFELENGRGATARLNVPA
ncbi:histidine kinase dimerization/phosphoacceptor domain -containing protein [Sphingomonas sp. AOB5]|uniref:sensor histidine kinase n=1 Tax=Sphingomonas sp. AOB5 TaxID=3034017 RepID=UPI0023F6BD46|nr:histidine kinase dimerization/phosphoacceptor domain -containing protein [Sphingomonas sp. AOB5]MDF7777493.1 histidine kinase dimerization/phosphoacceptor domain -containing protein [Sphingomonas sp. AOB5]